MYVAVGVCAIAAGVSLFAVTQFVLIKKIRKFNKEWEEEQNEMS